MLGLDKGYKPRIRNIVVLGKLTLGFDFFINAIPWVSRGTLPYTSFGTMAKRATVYFEFILKL